MAEPNASVETALAFGTRLDNLLLLWFGMAPKLKNVLVDLLGASQTCTTALRSLQEVLTEDDLASKDGDRIFTRAALEDIESFAIKCDLVYRAIILLLQKGAEDHKSESATDHNDNASSQDEKPDYKTDLLTRPVPDLSSPKTLGLISKLRGHHCTGWLTKALDHCADQLFWIQQRLLVHLQVAKYARQSLLQTGVLFDDQLVGRASILLLWNSHLKLTEKRVQNQEELQRLQNRRSKADENDNASVRSSSTTPSVATAVDSEAPNTGNTPADDEEPPKVSSPLPPPPPPAPVSVPEPASIDQAPDAKQDVPPATAPANGVKPKVSDKINSSLNHLGQKLSNMMTDWVHSIFGKDDIFKKDYESTELEAYVTYGMTPDLPVKLPFGHRRLQYGLKRTEKRKETTFNRYVSSKTVMHKIIDDVVREANRKQKRERTLLTYSVFENGANQHFMVAFFSIQPEKQPIAFKDAVGREYILPFQLCKNWEDMRVTIHEAFVEKVIVIPGPLRLLGPHVREGRYDLLNASTEKYILPGMWNTTIKPGDSIVMRMWPPPIQPLMGYYGRPFLGDPRLDADCRARSERLGRIRAAQPSFQPSNPMPVLLRPPPPPAPWTAPHRRRVPSTASSSARSRTSSSSSNEDANMAVEERIQLTFVDYAEELEKAKTTTLTDLLSKFTYLKDVSSDFMDIDDLDGYESDDSYMSNSTVSICD